jgi:hypothetical protein
MWAFHVNGFRPDRHCQPCFRGKRSPEFCTGRAESGRVYEFRSSDWYPYLYVCGVGSGPKDTLAGKNLHLPLRFAEGAELNAATYNGYEVSIRNAELLPIPPLPDGWNGRDRETTRCKNFQFAVAYFGLP